MRIAINTRFLLPGKMEGIGLFTQEVARRLVEKHPEDQFLFLFDRPFDPKLVEAPNVEGKVVFPPARHGFLWYLWFEWGVPRALKQWKADVFLSPDGYASLRSKVPTVMVTHDLAFEHYPEQVPGWAAKYYRRNMPRFHERAEQVVTVSEFTRQDVIDQYGTDSAKITTACNGVREGFTVLSEEERQQVRLKVSNGKPYFFYVGAVHPRKNVIRLIRAFDQYKRATGSDKKLVLAGRFAWQSEETRQAYETARFREDIVLLGYLDAAELSRTLGAAFALTYVSLFEGFGVPLLEAMWAEVPVISSTVSSMPEVCGDAGLLVDPTDVGAIAGALQEMEANTQLREQLIREGKQQRQKFSWDKAATVVDQVIRALGLSDKSLFSFQYFLVTS
jgi:glycosyltransferase involved in cell wall biosynthesis